MSTDSAPAVAAAATSEARFEKTRLLSLDALRGADMLLILGIDELVHGLRRVGDSPVIAFLIGQFDHKEWEGFALYDLIFPLFVFLVGISLVFSLNKAEAAGGTRSAIVRLSRRALLLFALGLFYNGGISKGLQKVRWMGVLQRIAISYFFAALIYLACGRNAKRVAAVFVLILAGYWAIMTFIPAPGRESVSFQPDENIANWIDHQYLPGRMYDKTWDPEGLLSSLPAVATCLLGVLTGMLLKNERLTPNQKAVAMLVAGAVCVALGFLWGLQFPVVKKIWTSSFVLVAGGYSLLLMGAFYLVIDVWKFRWGIAPLIWVGSNALTMYLISSFVNFPALAERFLGGEVKSCFGKWDRIAIEVAALALVIALAGFMYRRRIFVRV